MAETAKKNNPKLWDKVKATVTKGAKGGNPGQWSARKAQLAVSEYKREGGGYEGKKTADNHLVQWEREEWGTKSGQKSTDTGERYLPKNAREALTDEEIQAHDGEEARRHAQREAAQRAARGRGREGRRRAAHYAEQGRADGPGT